MSSAEPTEEQKQAAKAFSANCLVDYSHAIACLLAEREAKLRFEYLTNTCEMSDNVVYYRNLAVALGAKPEQMANEYDRKLCADGIDPDDDGNGYHMSVADVIAGKEANFDEADTLRARVAELEALFAAATSARVADKMENLKREAQHLADIKATIDLLRNPFAPHIERVQLLQRLAHYDDAKADAPASTEGEVRDE